MLVGYARGLTAEVRSDEGDAGTGKFHPQILGVWHIANHGPVIVSSSRVTDATLVIVANPSLAVKAA